MNFKTLIVSLGLIGILGLAAAGSYYGYGLSKPLSVRQDSPGPQRSVVGGGTGVGK